MSCELETLALIDDLAAVRASLKLENADNWLTSVLIATAPYTADGLLVFAAANRFTILRGHFDDEGGGGIGAGTSDSPTTQRYTIQHTATLPLNADTADSITAVACLPIAAFSSTANSPNDWTCVAVGFASGCVRFYNEHGTVLGCQQWQPAEAVLRLHQQAAYNHRGAVLTDELHVFHTSCVCIVPAGPLIAALRNRQSRQRTAEAEGGSGAGGGGGGGAVGPAAAVGHMELTACRKWTYGGKGTQLNDGVVIGAPGHSYFDYLASAGRSGFYSKLKTSAPLYSLVMGVGPAPYAAFHWANEGYVQPVLADVARAVARQIKSALPTWLTRSSTGGSAAGGEQPPAPPQPAEPMQLRFGLADQQRIGLAVWLAPDRQHAAVADSLGRVMLLDVRRGIAVRVWKGYRDAQCGFVAVRETAAESATLRPDDHRRAAQFLVLYAPKRACLECWLLQRGPRVAAFAVSKGARLLGAVPAEPCGGGDRDPAGLLDVRSRCLFVEAGGELRELRVPFHLALSDAYARTSKDLHLIRRIRSALRADGAAGDEAAVVAEVAACCAEMQTDELRIKCVEKMVRHERIRPAVLLAAMQAFGASVQEEVDGEEPAADGEDEEDEPAGLTRKERDNQKRLRSLVTVYSALAELYTTIHIKPEAEEAEDEMAVAQPLNLSVTELENIEQFVTLRVLETGGLKSPTKVHFAVTETAANSATFLVYLELFRATSRGPRLRETLRTEALAAVGEHLFGPFIERGLSPNSLALAKRAASYRIRAEDLMQLLIAYWLDRPFAYTKSSALLEHLQAFADTVEELCRLRGPQDTALYEYNTISAWWQQVREDMLITRSPVQGWLASIACRALAARLCREANAALDAEMGGAGTWEQVPQEAAEWSLLVEKMDDVAVLALALNSSMRNGGGVMVVAADEDGEPEGEDEVETTAAEPMPVIPFGVMPVSLEIIVRGGRGIVSDLIAKWIISLTVAPEVIADFNKPQPAPLRPSGDRCAQLFTHYWQFLRVRFPFSLQAGVVLGHMAWEYFCHWTKNMAQMQLFVAALRCLAAIPADEQRLKHGLCCMIWNAHLKIPLQATAKLIHKTGRLPTEALCMQDIGLSASLVADLLEHTDAFWTQFVDSRERWRQQDKEHEEAVNPPPRKPLLRHEDLLVEGPVALAQLALDQPPAVAELLRIHHELIQVLLLMAALNMRHPRPMKVVFDAMSQLAFFTEISRYNKTLPPADEVLCKRRTDFLVICISATIDLVRLDLDGTVYEAEHAAWMRRVQRLAAAWHLSEVDMCRYQVAYLYAHGWDESAAARFERRLYGQMLGDTLLQIAARRLMVYMKGKPKVYTEVSSVGSGLTDYLDKLHNTPDRFQRSEQPPFSLDAMIDLSGRVFACLGETQGRSKRVAAHLHDACQRLKDRELTASGR